MNRRFVTGALALGVAVAAMGALTNTTHATAFLLDGGVFDPVTCNPDCSGSYAPLISETGSINDTYGFQVTIGGLLNIDSITNSFAQEGAQIKNLELLVFQNSGTSLTPTPAGAAIADVFANFSSGAGIGSQFASTGPLSLAPGGLNDGMYFIEVMGSTVDTTGTVFTKYSGSFSFSPTPTPLPATLPLLAGGLAGRWACVRRRKRTKVGPCQ
jgi:hypothetical protein